MSGGYNVLRWLGSHWYIRLYETDTFHLFFFPVPFLVFWRFIFFLFGRRVSFSHMAYEHGFYE